MTDDLTPVRAVTRAVPLDDIHIRSDGSGRVVEAYAAVFRTRSEVVDQDGHYMEEIAPTSFARTLQHKGPAGFSVLFNHGCTIAGTPAGELTIPIGVPLDVRADDRGVFTATRYLDNPLADSVLQAIKAGALKAQSFSGRFMRSVRSWPDGRGRDKLSLIVRHEVDMREYGPAVFAQYPEAAILGARAADVALAAAPTRAGGDPLTLFVRALQAMPAEQRSQFLETFEVTTPPATAADPVDLDGTPEPTAPSGADPGRADAPGTPIPGPAAQTDDAREHSARSSPDWREQLRQRRARLGV